MYCSSMGSRGAGHGFGALAVRKRGITQDSMGLHIHVQPSHMCLQLHMHILADC